MAEEHENLAEEHENQRALELPVALRPCLQFAEDQRAAEELLGGPQPEQQ